MTQNGNGNGDKTDQKKGSERDEKGRFVMGNLGGPGRGKESENLDDLDDLDFWSAIENMLRKDMKSKNDTTRSRAVNTYLKWKVMKDEYDEKNEGGDTGVYSPEVLELLKMRDIGHELGGVEGMRKMIETCPGCDKFPNKTLKFNFPQQEGTN